MVREKGVPVARLVPAARMATRTARYMPYRRYRNSSMSPRSIPCGRKGKRPAFRKRAGQ